MSADPVPVPYAGVYHRPSQEFCLVTAIHRSGDEVTGYDLRNDYAQVQLTNTPVAEVDVWRNEVEGITTIWRDLKPGMTMMWIDGLRSLAGEKEPHRLDVVAIHRPADAGAPWEIEAVQGGYEADPTFMFDEVTPQLADLIGSLVMEEQDRW